MPSARQRERLTEPETLTKAKAASARAGVCVLTLSSADACRAAHLSRRAWAYSTRGRIEDAPGRGEPVLRSIELCLGVVHRGQGTRAYPRPPAGWPDLPGVLHSGGPFCGLSLGVPPDS
jgi:hypothetical protein